MDGEPEFRERRGPEELPPPMLYVKEKLAKAVRVDTVTNLDVMQRHTPMLIDDALLAQHLAAEAVITSIVTA